MLEMMRGVLAWLRFLAWGVFYMLVMVGIIAICGALITLPWITLWLWGTPIPGTAATIIIMFLGCGMAIAGVMGKAPK